MYNLCCFKPPPVHLSHVFPQINSRRPSPPAEFVTAILLIETFISIRLIVQARLSEFRCAGAERCSWLYIARVMRGKREEAESDQWRRTSARSLSSPLKSGDTNFCSPASKRVLGEIYHFCPRDVKYTLTPLCRKSAPLKGEHRCSAGSAGQAVTQEHEIESSDHCQLLHCNKRASSRWLHHAPFLIGLTLRSSSCPPGLCYSHI